MVMPSVHYKFDNSSVYESNLIDMNGYYKKKVSGKGFREDGSISNGVIFIDYDGTVVESYDKDEFKGMSEFPPNPKHEGLISQGWNYSLDKIKYYLEKYENIVLTVGQMYCTADDATHIYLNVHGRLTVPLMFQQSVENGVSLDWGDGSDPETVAGTGAVTTEHTYAAEGEYILKMKAANGCEMNFGDGDTSNIFGESDSRKYSSFITKIYISKDVTSIGQYTFNNCFALQSLVIPEGVTSIEQYAFNGCYVLQSLVIPEGVTSIGQYAFNNCFVLQPLVIPEGVTSIGQNAFSSCYASQSLIIPEGVTSIGQYAFLACYSLRNLVISEGVTSIGNSTFAGCFALQSLVIPEGVTSIGTSAFNNCYALQSLVIPEGVTSIASNAFSWCYSLLNLVLNSETPPTLANTNAFTSLPSDCVIYIPASSVDTYKAASNWSTFAEQIQAIPEETP